MFIILLQNFIVRFHAAVYFVFIAFCYMMLQICCNSSWRHSVSLEIRWWWQNCLHYRSFERFDGKHSIGDTLLLGLWCFHLTWKKGGKWPQSKHFSPKIICVLHVKFNQNYSPLRKLFLLNYWRSFLWHLSFSYSFLMTKYYGLLLRINCLTPNIKVQAFPKRQILFTSLHVARSNKTCNVTFSYFPCG
jgi:hypothetical protein